MMENGEISDELAHGLIDEDAYLVGIEHDDGSSEKSFTGPLREQDRFLPIANIAKIMKRAIPDNGKIAKDARECVQECISEFISFVTSEASDRCLMEKRKTINGEDVLYAMNTLGFDNYIEPLKLYLKKYRETVLSPVTLKVGGTKQVVVLDSNFKVTDEESKGSEQDQQEECVYVYPKNLSDYIN